MGKEIPEIDNDEYIKGTVDEFLEYWEDEIYSASIDDVVEALCLHLKRKHDDVFDILEKHI